MIFSFKIKLTVAARTIMASMIIACINPVYASVAVADAEKSNTEMQQGAVEDQSANRFEQKLLAGLNLNQYLAGKLVKEGVQSAAGQSSDYRYSFKKAAELKAISAQGKPKQSDLRFLLDTEVQTFSFKTDVEQQDHKFQKRHELSYSIIFRLLNEEQQVLFEKEKNFNAVYNSYESNTADPYDLSPILQQWLEDRVHGTLDEVAQEMASLMPLAAVENIEQNHLHVKASQQQFQGQESKEFVVYKPVQMFQHPYENRLMRITGGVVGHAIYKGYENGQAVFELQTDSKPDDTETLYIIQR